MSLDAGRRNKRITIEQRTAVDDGYGGDIETWTLFAKPWASVFYGSGAEQREAAQQGGSQSASFEVLSNSKTRIISVANHRVLHDGGVWDIRSVAPIGLNEGVKINAVRSAA